MLTITPPETREDEIQVDETDDRNLMLRLSPTRLNAKRKERNAHGFNYIQLIVGMIIFVALSRIVGPPAFRMITRARSTALSANIQTAAETVRNVIAIEPALVTNADITAATAVAANATPTDGLIARLTDDAPFQWEGGWDLVAGEASNVIRMQLIHDHNANAAAAAAAGVPPTVDWLLTDWDAVRIHAQNEDGSWACALIVLKPQTDGLSRSGAALTDAEVSLANAQLRGVWYDSGEAYTTANQVHHCSPVHASTSATVFAAPLPTDANTWTIPEGFGTVPASPAATLTRSS